MSEVSPRTPSAKGTTPRVPRRTPTRATEPEADVPGFELTLDEERVPAPVRENSYRAYTPANIGAHLESFQRVAERIGDMDRAAARREIEKEIAAADELERGFAADLRPRSLSKYRAALLVLADLLAQDWAYRFRDHTLELAPPDFTEAPTSPEDVQRQKAAIRRSMRAERLAQLQPDSVKRFLKEMEERRDRGGEAGACSVLDLVADGDGLARELRDAQRLGADYEARALDLVRPYLQHAKEGENCPQTGFRLLDIWRYFRYHWSLPYFSTPGRNLFYLVRDGARPFHPVIGIAALGNSLVRLADRERALGWDVSSLRKRLKDAGDERAALGKTLYEHLLSIIEREITALDPRGIIDPKELQRPTDETVLRLAHLAKDSAQRRRDLLRRAEAEAPNTNGNGSKRSRPLDPSQLMLSAANVPRTLADQSVEELFKQKRAAQYSDLIRAKLIFQRYAKDGSIEPMLADEDGERALTIAIKNIKQEHIGSSMMDIIICGAIPPYSHLLGGKLVCMLLASPEVRMDYRDRYEAMPSEIASMMRGTGHAKRADLVFLGTTSLYHVGSSQYNRVRVPASVAGGTAGEIRYERLGETRGYGSVHFSERTRELLEAICKDDKGASLITRTFGEGVNPKLRLVREGLAAIGVDQDHFLRHQCRRIIYGVQLAKNTGEYLRNEATTPEFILPAETREQAQSCTRNIAAQWIRRWMAPRAKSHDVLDRVATTTQRELHMSNAALVGEREASEYGPGPEGPRSEGGGNSGRKPPPSAGDIGVRFIQQLYNHRSCYADRLTDEQLAAIHVETPLESFIIDQLRAGKDVILTGNPGDGKTHLIMKLQSALKAIGAEQHADATAEESYDVLLDIWRKARKRKKPFCLAINEWPLLEFIRAHSSAFKPLVEVREQIENGIVYGASADTQSVVVVDLNNRNLVSLDVFKKLLSTLTDDRFYPECRSCPAQRTCDVPRARRALAEPRVRERLFRVLELVTKRGHHVTMRDLQGFVAFLLTGGRSCEQLVAQEHEKNPRPYFNLAFEGDSALFDAVREVFDPARVTHPLYDDQLWSGGLKVEGWTPLGPPSPPPSKSPNDPIDSMRSAKRRFFFEHEDGEKLVQLLPQDERKFYEALSAAPEHGQRVVRDLLRLINRFFDARDEDDSVLRLWSRHRYDARWSPTYVSVRSVPADRFRLEVPRLPKSTAKAFTYQPDHVVLAAYRKDERVARLTVDLGLYRTLYDAQRGLPMALRSAEVLKRIDVFFNELSRAFRAQHDIEDVHIKNFETGEDLKFKVDRRHKRFAL